MSDDIADSLRAGQSNDAFFKEVFSRTPYAAAFFQSHLPPALAGLIDWESLAHVPGSFVKTNLQQAHSDLLFTAQCGGESVLLYLLFEHQSTPLPAMPLRLLEYMVGILSSHEAKNGLPLPPVIPFVLHQGPASWNVSRQFQDLFGLPAGGKEAFAPFLPKFEHDLLDLSRFDPTSEEDHARLRVILNLMKAAREQRVMEFFEWLGRGGGSLALLLEDDLLRLCMIYAWNTDDELDVESVARHLLNEPKLRTSAMTTAEKLITKGREEGREAGEWIGKLLLLEEMMNLPASRRQELAALPVADLKARFATLEARYRQSFRKMP